MRLALLPLLIAVLLVPFKAGAQSLEDMAGQMIMMGFSGSTTSDDGVRAVREQIASGTIGGVMYLRTNVSSLGAVRAINRSLVAARPWMPPFIALDQEGGNVQRLTSAVGFSERPSAAEMSDLGLTRAEALYADLGVELAAQGFNLNLGPVVDLALNPANPIIARFGRAYGDDPDTVTAFATAFVSGHRSAGVVTALKHFPGHGSSTEDTHLGFVDVSDVWQEIELEPYRRMIGAGLADMVMVAHLHTSELGGGGALQLPATLSPEWISGVLRTDLGFSGVVISDDLEMGAIRSRFDLADTVVRAVMAGNDILLFSNTAEYDPALGESVHAVLVEHGEADPAFAERIAESYDRIVALKREAGIVP